ncbi:hypothetical protein BGW80DRAFT_1327568 [Lactifluus volemus]|nr:hypothetical protein BGW80DRAFT_1327568 [Lactifluus volemus]
MLFRIDGWSIYITEYHSRILQITAILVIYKGSSPLVGSWSFPSSSSFSLPHIQAAHHAAHPSPALAARTRSRGYWLSDRRLGHISRSSDKPVDTGYTLGCRIRVHTALATPPFQLEVSGRCLGPSESTRGSPGELHIPWVDSSAELSNDEATLPTAQRKQRAAVVYLTTATSPETGMRYLEIYFLHLTTTRHFPSLIGSEARSNAPDAR